MLCEKCKKKTATIFYEENINGSKRSYALCNDCASEMEKEGVTDSVFSTVHQLFPFSALGGLFGNTVLPAVGEVCPTCHASLRDFQINGKVGCPECYTFFARELEDTVRSIHGNTRHVGRTPARLQGDPKKQNRLTQLRSQLKEAVVSEDYERAAALRDQIRELEGK